MPGGPRRPKRCWNPDSSGFPQTAGCSAPAKRVHLLLAFTLVRCMPQSLCTNFSSDNRTDPHKARKSASRKASPKPNRTMQQAGGLDTIHNRQTPGFSLISLNENFVVNPAHGLTGICARRENRQPARNRHRLRKTWKRLRLMVLSLRGN